VFFVALLKFSHATQGTMIQEQELHEQRSSNADGDGRGRQAS
jgi:hypothetical protein